MNKESCKKQINTQKSVVFLYTNMSYQKEKLRNNPVYNHNKKNKTPSNTFNQGGERLIH